MAHVLSYCGDVVRKQDPDRFLLSLFSPAGSRDSPSSSITAQQGLWALFAFNYEIAKTREVVSETQLGLIRLQWWRDAIAAIYDPPSSDDYGATSGGDVPQHEVVQPLAAAIKAYDLPRELFDTLIYAREFDLEDVLPSDMDGFLNYADFTSTPLMKLAVMITGGNAEAEPVQPIAVNYAITGILRSVVHMARHRRCYLPEKTMQSYGVSVNQMYELKAQSALKDVVAECAGHFAHGVRAESRFLRAAQGLAEIYMRQIAGCGYDVFDPRLARPPAFKELRVFFKAL